VERETAAAVDADGDGQVGTVTIGPQDGAAVNGARRRIELILDPPKAEVGAVYAGRVVNITKFGAFVNILPGRDGLVHISKLGRGKRIERVEDVLDLGDELTVRVDDVDPQGKVSLSPVGDGDGDKEGADRSPVTVAAPRQSAGSAASSPPSAAEASPEREYASFEESFEAEAKQAFGDLGPADGGGGGGGERGGGGPRRNRR